MLFAVLLSLTTFSIAGTAAFFSVYGLANMFAGYFWSVAFMGSALEAGKLIAASYLYRYWKPTSILMRAYLLFAVFVLMVITSTGIFGYLSAGYQSDTAPLKQSQQQISLIDTDLAALQARKQEIDGQVSKLNTNDVVGRQRLTRMFDQEIRSINKRIPELTQQKQQLMQKNLEIEAHVGPIVYIAGAFGLSTDDAIKYIILMLIAVFDPLAIILTICLNVIIAEHRNKYKQKDDYDDAASAPSDYRSNSRTFTDIAFDLIGNRSVAQHDDQQRDAAPVTTQSISVPESADQQPRVVSQLDAHVDRADHQVPEAEVAVAGGDKIGNDQQVAENVVVASSDDRVDHNNAVLTTNATAIEPPVEYHPDSYSSTLAPRDSILDRWLKFRQQ